MAIKALDGCVVRLAYRITDAEGRLIEERTPEHAYEYVQGGGQIVGPVERAVLGKTPGYRTEVNVTPRDGYGEYDPALVTELPLSSFPPGSQVEPRMKFNTTGPSGKVLTVRVVDVHGTSVTVDGNHPLAGIELIFEIRVLDVREGTEEEMDTGRVHDPKAAKTTTKPGAGSGPPSGALH